MMRLQRYKIKVVYKKGSTMYLADTLSRATLPTTNESKETNFEIFRLDLEDDKPVNEGITSETLKKVKAETLKDTAMNDLAKVIISGWPESKCQLPQSACPYWTFKDEMTVQDGLIYKGTQVVIPPGMRGDMLKKIHVAHLGAGSNYRMCKDILFWPGLKAEVQDMCDACGKCAQFKPQNPKEPMKSQPIPDYPWQFISQDICCFETTNFLVTVDHYSDFIEVDELSNWLPRSLQKLKHTSLVMEPQKSLSQTTALSSLQQSIQISVLGMVLITSQALHCGHRAMERLKHQ